MSDTITKSASKRDHDGLHAKKSIEEELTGVFRNAQHTIEHRYEECEERVRKSPGSSMMTAFACGYLLRSLPVEAIVAAQVRLALSLVRPALFLYGTAKVYEFVVGRATPKR